MFIEWKNERELYLDKTFSKCILDDIRRMNTMKAKNETKHQRFVRLAEARTNRIIATLRLLGNCSNPAAYEYSKAEIIKVFHAIDDAVASAKRRFEQKDSDAKPFSLGE